MSDNQRTTRECSFTDLHPALGAAIRAHIHQYQLEDPAQALFCCETISTRQKKGLFASKPEVMRSGALLTANRLVWAAGKDGETAVALSARLRDIQVQDYEQSGLAKLAPDSGVNILGLRTDAVELGSAFIGLGPEPAARHFRELLKKMVEERS